MCDPHLLPEHSLDGDVDCNHEKEAHAEVQKPPMAPPASLSDLGAAVHDQPHAALIQRLYRMDELVMVKWGEG